MGKEVFWKRFIVKKVIILGLIIIAGVIFGVLNGLIAPVNTQIAIDASTNAFRGDNSILEAQAFSNIGSSLIVIGRIISLITMVILSFIFLFDIGADLFKHFYKSHKTTEESKE